MPIVLNIRDLPGFKEGRPIIPPGTVYIGRASGRYGLQKSKWANPFRIRHEGDRTTAIAAYERWLRQQPRLMDALPELDGYDLVDIGLGLSTKLWRSSDCRENPTASIHL